VIEITPAELLVEVTGKKYDYSNQCWKPATAMVSIRFDLERLTEDFLAVVRNRKEFCELMFAFPNFLNSFKFTFTIKLSGLSTRILLFLGKDKILIP
jgi:hypothetical protein